MGKIASDDKNTDKIVLTQGPFEQLREELTDQEEPEADGQETMEQMMEITAYRGEANVVITESGDEYPLGIDD